MKSSVVLLAAIALSGCGSAPPPAASAGAPAAPAPTAVSNTPVATASSSAPAADAPRPQRPLALANNCLTDVHLYYGDQPGDGKGQAALANAGAIIQVPRNPDGTVVVWVTDDKGNGLASVHVTKYMRHIRIDATCSKIEADSSR
jgi:hypothetical protein